MDKSVIDTDLDGFRIIFRHRSMTEEEGASYSRANVSEAILDFVSRRGSATSAEIADAAGISRKTASRHLSRLVGEGILEGLGSLNSPKRRYRLSGKR